MPQRVSKPDRTTPAGQNQGLGYVPTRVVQNSGGGGSGGIIISGPPGDITVSIDPSVLAGIGMGIGAEDGQEGERGPPGVNGVAGAAGATGPAGPPGFALDGLDGEEGMPIPGPQGPTGATGAAGATGPAGGIGVPGFDGDEGPMGFSIPGPMGVAGSSGSAGATGPAGPPGFPGFDGEDGSDGFSIVGPQGPIGATGATGPSGYFTQGFDGQDGEEGQPGPPGITGLTGPTGLPDRTIVQLHANSSIANNTFAAFSWASSDILSDPDGAWSAGAPTKFTTPVGKTQARVTVCPYWASSSVGARWAQINIGGTTVNSMVRTASNESTDCGTTIWFTGLTAGTTYFELCFAQTSGAGLNLLGGSGFVAACRVMIEWN